MSGFGAHRQDVMVRTLVSGDGSSFMLECRHNVQSCSSHPVTKWHQVNSEGGGQRDEENLGPR